MATTYKVRVFEIQKRYRRRHQEDAADPIRRALVGGRRAVSRRASSCRHRRSSFRSDLMSARRGEASTSRAGGRCRCFALQRADIRGSSSRRTTALRVGTSCPPDPAATSSRPVGHHGGAAAGGAWTAGYADLGKALRIAFNVKTRQRAPGRHGGRCRVGQAAQSRSPRAGRPASFGASFPRWTRSGRNARGAGHHSTSADDTRQRDRVRDRERAPRLQPHPKGEGAEEQDRAARGGLRCGGQPHASANPVARGAHINRRLVAFFGLMYFAGLRPEEAVNVRKRASPSRRKVGARSGWSAPYRRSVASGRTRGSATRKRHSNTASGTRAGRCHAARS